MKPVGLIKTPISFTAFREKLQLNKTIEAEVAYRIYELSLVTKAHLNKSRNFTVMCIDTSLRALQDNTLLWRNLRLLGKILPEMDLNYNGQAQACISSKGKTICNIALATKDNCAAVAVGMAITHFVYITEELSYQQKKWAERLSTYRYGHFGSAYPFLAANLV